MTNLATSSGTVPRERLGPVHCIPFHESNEGSMGSKGVDCEGILSLDVDDVCSRWWEFQLDVHKSNGMSSVKGSLGKYVWIFGGKNYVLLHGL